MYRVENRYIRQPTPPKISRRGYGTHQLYTLRPVRMLQNLVFRDGVFRPRKDSTRHHQKAGGRSSSYLSLPPFPPLSLSLYLLIRHPIITASLSDHTRAHTRTHTCIRHSTNLISTATFFFLLPFSVFVFFFVFPPFPLEPSSTIMGHQPCTSPFRVSDGLWRQKGVPSNGPREGRGRERRGMGIGKREMIDIPGAKPAWEEKSTI